MSRTLSRGGRRGFATLVAVAITMFALLAGAGPASAHNVLISSDPEDGAQLDAGPDQVTLTFDQYVQDADVNQVAVTGPDGGQWTEGPVEVQENVVTAPLRPLGPAGEYTLGFRILSADGHSVQEKIRFTLTTAGTGTPAAGASASAAGADPGAENADPGSAEGDTDSGGVPIWVWIAAAVVLLGVGLTLALRMGRNAE